ncbi:MAG: dipeptide epimerase [candidate division Zixibacteria bacterium]|nr:dipeptide epimerase [candidate division Zixibacteria bacterium]
MRLTYDTIDLELKHPFRISRSVTKLKKNVVVHIDEGIGEAAPSQYYGENADTVIQCLKEVKDQLGDDPFQIEVILSNLDKKVAGDFSAKAAIDMALHDLVAKRLNLPLYQFLGLDGKTPLITSYTIGIDTPEKMKEKTKQAKDFLVYKVKVGVENDIEMVKAVREVTDAKIRVDANAGWNTEEALDKIRQLKEYDIEFVEQPIDPKDKTGLKKIKERSEIPIIIDEQLMTSRDIPDFVGLCDGINIKLAKCGGIREALRMIHVARAHGLKVMLGCMIESSVGIAAAAHLGSLVDFLDLDGNLLVSNDPYEGLRVDKGKLYLSDLPGLGVVPKDQ